eukprot:gene4850-6797_t
MCKNEVIDDIEEKTVITNPKNEWSVQEISNHLLQLIKQNPHAHTAIINQIPKNNNEEITEESINEVFQRLVMQDIPGGVTNYCFRCYDPLNPQNSIFIKHARALTRGFENKNMWELSPKRLFYEYEGMKSFAKYTPQLVPMTYDYDSNENCIMYQYLDGYKPLVNLFVNGDMDRDYTVFLGTLMGRNHAKTFHTILPQSQHQKYISKFTNNEHFELWISGLFNPTYKLLDNLSNGLDRNGNKIENSDENNNNSDLLSITADEFLTKLNKNNIFTKALHKLEYIYLHKKQTLIHADLHANNILYKQNDDNYDDDDNQTKINLKVIDFEKCCYGPAGLDLGLYITNYLWYYVAHSNNNARKNILSQLLALLEAYKSAFRIQLTGAMRLNTKTMTKDELHNYNESLNVEQVINDILIDSFGFAAMFAFFLTVTIPDVVVLDLKNVPGYDWGDKEGRKHFVRRRMIRIIKDLFEITLANDTFPSSLNTIPDQPRSINDPEPIYDNKKESIFITSALIENILKKDNYELLHDHYTEHWFI